MSFNRVRLTSKGKEIIARSLTTGKQVIYTKIIIGSGYYNDEVLGLTALVEPQKTLTLDAVEVEQSTGVTRIEAWFTNQNISKAFRWREIGLYAKVDGDVDDFLYSYSNSEERGIIVPTELDLIFSRHLAIKTSIGENQYVSFEVIEKRDKYIIRTLRDLETTGYLTEGDVVEVLGENSVFDDGYHRRIIRAEEVAGAIRLPNGVYAEIITGSDYNSKQNKNDNTLTTDSKLVVGAINELKWWIDWLKMNGGGGGVNLLTELNAVQAGQIFDYGTLLKTTTQITVGSGVLFTPLLFLDGEVVPPTLYTVDKNAGVITLNAPYAVDVDADYVVFDHYPHSIKFSVPTIVYLMNNTINASLELGDVIEIQGTYIKFDGGQHLRIVESTAKLDPYELNSGLYLNKVPNSGVDGTELNVAALNVVYKETNVSEQLDFVETEIARIEGIAENIPVITGAGNVEYKDSKSVLTILEELEARNVVDTSADLTHDSGQFGGVRTLKDALNAIELILASGGGGGGSVSAENVTFGIDSNVRDELIAIKSYLEGLVIPETSAQLTHEGESVEVAIDNLQNSITTLESQAIQNIEGITVKKVIASNGNLESCVECTHDGDLNDSIYFSNLGAGNYQSVGSNLHTFGNKTFIKRSKIDGEVTFCGGTFSGDITAPNLAYNTTQVIAGNGLTGGGDLTASRTINIASANAGIVVNADNIELKPATTSIIGGVKPDGTTLTVDINGLIKTVDNKFFTNNGIPMPAGTNLNTFLTKGHYTTESNANTSTMTNTPFGGTTSFTLVVDGIGDVYYTQLATRYDGVQSCRVTYNNGANWTAWTEIVNRTTGDATYLKKAGDISTGAQRIRQRAGEYNETGFYIDATNAQYPRLEIFKSEPTAGQPDFYIRRRTGDTTFLDLIRCTHAGLVIYAGGNYGTINGSTATFSGNVTAPSITIGGYVVTIV